MEKGTGSKKTTSLKGNIRIKLKKKDTKRATMGKTKTAKPVKTLKLVSKSQKAATSTDATVDEEGLNKNSALSKDEKTDASKPSKSKMDKTKSTKSDKDGKTLSSKINLKHKSIKERQKSKKIDKKLIVPKTAKSAEHSPTVNVSMINKSKIQSNEPQIQLCTTPVKSSLELSHSTPTSTIDPSKELDISAMKSIFASPNKYPSNKGTPMGSSRQLDFDGGIEVTPIKSVNNAVDEESNPESKVKSKSNREKSETKSMRDLEKEIFGDSDSDDSDDMFKISPKVQLLKIKATPSKSGITPVKSECTPAKSEITPETSPCKQDDHPGHDEIQALQAELSSLNADSAGLNTSIHRTPVKHNKTSKRRKTPRKKTPLKSNSKKPRNITPIPLHGDSDDSADWEDVEDDDDDDDDTGLKIFEGDDVIDRKIEKHAQQSNLTALNVKTIIREVISNKSVVQMLKNTLKDAQNEEESSHDDDEPIQSNYELKMTRSKVKQVMGDEIPHPWLNSPKKKVTGVKKTAPFLDMTFSDEEEEDYNPEADDVEMDDSDVDSESVMSSQPGSDFGSPCPLTPTTPSSTLRTIAEESNTPKSTIMGPPQTPAFRSASKAHVERNLLSELSQSGSESQEPLARRTRSKLPLTDTPIDVIEQEFVAPDITEDMYDTYCDDVSWKTFLESLHSSQPTENLNDSTLDDDDEEYNFLAEVEEEAEDPEDLRDDKATKVSKKELQELMEELFEAYGSPDGLEEDSQPYEDNQTASTTSEPSSPEMNVFNNPEPVKLDVKLATTLLRKDFMMKRKEQVAPAPVQSARETIIMTVKEREQLDDQMRKHVQLLGQTYVLGIGTEDYKKHSLVCKGYVNELAKFSEGSKVEKSAYKAANLHHAVELVNNECVPPGFTLRKSSRRLVFETPDLSLEQMKVFLDNGTFIYPDIVPTGNFLSCDVNAKMKTLFLEWEDNLIALGLSQLTEVPVRQQHELLSATWLPTKTEEQIRCRIKNMKTKKAKANAIKFFKTHAMLPQFDRSVQEFNPEQPKALWDQGNMLPPWIKTYVEHQFGIKVEKDIIKPVVPLEANPEEVEDPDDQYSAMNREPLTAKEAVLFSNMLKSNLTQDKIRETFGGTVTKPGPDKQPLVSIHPQQRPSTPQQTITPSGTASEYQGFTHQGALGVTTQPLVLPPSEPTPTIVQIVLPDNAIKQPMVPSINVKLPVSGASIPNQVPEIIETNQILPVSTIPHMIPINSALPFISANKQPLISCETLGTQILNSNNVSQSMLGNNLATISSERTAVYNTALLHHKTAPLEHNAAIIDHNTAIIDHTTATLQPSAVHNAAVNESVSETLESVADVRNVIFPSGDESDIDVVSIDPDDKIELKTMKKDELKEGLISSVAESHTEEQKSPEATSIGANDSMVSVSTNDSVVSRLTNSNSDNTDSTLKSRSSSGSSSTISNSSSLSGESSSTNNTCNISSLSGCSSKMGNSSLVSGFNTSTMSGLNISGVSTDLHSSTEGSTVHESATDSSVEMSDTGNVSGVSSTMGHSSSQGSNIPDVSSSNVGLNSSQEKDTSGGSDIGTSLIDRGGDTGSNTGLNSRIGSTQPDISLSVISQSTPTKPAETTQNELNILSPLKHGQKTPPPKVKVLIITPEQRETRKRLLPKPVDESENSRPKVSPFLPKVPKEPPAKKKKSVVSSSQKKPILPKYKDFKIYIMSPTKKAAASISAKARKKLRRLTPKPMPLETTKREPCIIKKTVKQQRNVSKRPHKLRPIQPKPLDTNEGDEVEINDGYLEDVGEDDPYLTSEYDTQDSDEDLEHHDGENEDQNICDDHMDTVDADTADADEVDPDDADTADADEGDGDNIDADEGDVDVDTADEGDVDADTVDIDVTEDQENKENEEKPKRRRTRRVRRRLPSPDSTTDAGHYEADGSQNEDEGDDEDHMATLMAASSTIRFDPTRNEPKKYKGRKEKLLQRMYDENIVSSDPKRDDKDTLVAQAFLTKALQLLKGDIGRYMDILKLLMEEKDVTMLYKGMAELLKDYPQLLEQFSDFLSPDQAWACGCLPQNLAYSRARRFLRKLEIFCGTTNSTNFHRIKHTMLQWENQGSNDVQELKRLVVPLLRGQQHLLHEFSQFFPQDKPPESKLNDCYEEVVLNDSDEDDSHKFDGFEELTLPETNKDKSYGSRRCHCPCHFGNKISKEFKKRRKHCYNCSMKIMGGKIYIQQGKTLHQAEVVYRDPLPPHSPVSTQPGSPLGEDEDTMDSVLSKDSQDDVFDNARDVDEGFEEIDKEVTATDNNKVAEMMTLERIQNIPNNNKTPSPSKPYMIDQSPSQQTDVITFDNVDDALNAIDTAGSIDFTKVTQVEAPHKPVPSISQTKKSRRVELITLERTTPPRKSPIVNLSAQGRIPHISPPQGGLQHISPTRLIHQHKSPVKNPTVHTSPRKHKSPGKLHKSPGKLHKSPGKFQGFHKSPSKYLRSSNPFLRSPLRIGTHLLQRKSPGKLRGFTRGTGQKVSPLMKKNLTRIQLGPATTNNQKKFVKIDDALPDSPSNSNHGLGNSNQGQGASNQGQRISNQGQGPMLSQASTPQMRIPTDFSEFRIQFKQNIGVEITAKELTIPTSPVLGEMENQMNSQNIGADKQSMGELVGGELVGNIIAPRKPVQAIASKNIRMCTTPPPLEDSMMMDSHSAWSLHSPKRHTISPQDEPFSAPTPKKAGVSPPPLDEEAILTSDTSCSSLPPIGNSPFNNPNSPFCMINALQQPTAEVLDHKSERGEEKQERLIMKINLTGKPAVVSSPKADKKIAIEEDVEHAKSEDSELPSSQGSKTGSDIQVEITANSPSSCHDNSGSFNDNSTGCHDNISSHNEDSGSSKSRPSHSDSTSGDTNITWDSSTASNMSMDAANWTKENDHMVLRECKEQGTKQETFDYVANELGKTPLQVRQRFKLLMRLFNKEMTSDESSDDNTDA